MLKDLVIQNRSHREFISGTHISEEVIREWISNANSCPAAMNLQTLKYRIVSDAHEVARLLPLTRWAASLNKKLPPEGQGPAAFIVMCHDTALTPMKPIFMIDVGICAQTVMLAATEAGYGGCMLGAFSAEEVSDALSLSPNLSPVLILGLGEPADKVVLTEAMDGNTKYYRDANNVHYVPKRPLDEIIIK